VVIIHPGTNWAQPKATATSLIQHNALPLRHPHHQIHTEKCIAISRIARARAVLPTNPALHTLVKAKLEKMVDRCWQSSWTPVRR